MRRTFTRVTSLFGWDSEAIASLRRKLDRVLSNQKRQEESMATAQEVIADMTREVQESRKETAEMLESVQKVVTFMQGVPAMIKAAVDEALAANPGVDLTPLSLLVAEMNQQQGQLDEAQLAINGALSTAQAPVEPPVVTEPDAPMIEPGPEPSTRLPLDEQGLILEPAPTPEPLEENAGERPESNP